MDGDEGSIPFARSIHFIASAIVQRKVQEIKPVGTKDYQSFAKVIFIPKDMCGET